MPEGFEYFPPSFKAWKSPSSPYEQEGFAQYCVRYHCVLWTAYGLFALCYTLLQLTDNPGVTNAVAVAFRGTVTNRKALAGTLTPWLPCALCCLVLVLRQQRAALLRDLFLPAHSREQRVSHEANAKLGPQQSRQRTLEMSFLSTPNTEGGTSSLCCCPQWKNALIIARLPS